jgi:hypothetical protein
MMDRDMTEIIPNLISTASPPVLVEWRKSSREWEATSAQP